MGVFSIFSKNREIELLQQEIKELKKDSSTSAINRQLQNQANLYNLTFFDLLKNLPILNPDKLTDLVEYYQNNALIYALIDWKANKASEIKPCLYKVIDSVSAKEYKKWNGKYTEGYELKQLKKLKERSYEEIDLDDIPDTDLKYGKLKKLFYRPNDLNTWKLFVYQYIAFKDVCGFAVMWGNRLTSGANMNQFEQLYMLPSHQVQIIGGTPFQPIQGYRIQNNVYTKDFLANDSFLISNFSINYETKGSHLYGQSRVKAAVTEIDTYIASKLRELYSYKTGDSATLIFPKDIEFANALADKSKEERQSFIDEVFKRLNQTSRHNVGVFPYGIETAKIDSPLKDSNTSEAQQKIKETLCAVFHIAPPVIGSQEASTYNNMKEAVKMSLRDAVFPDMRDLAETFQHGIIPLYQSGNEKLEVEFDYDVFDEFSQDIESQANALSKMDFLSDNQKLKWFDYEPIEDERANLPQKYWSIDLGNIMNDGSYNNDTTTNQ